METTLSISDMRSWRIFHYCASFSIKAMVIKYPYIEHQTIMLEGIIFCLGHRNTEKGTPKESPKQQIANVAGSV